ncbi:MAG: cation:proton antiporter [Spirochaetes bacterium]|nr:cation:proton antiporter [Spirochaetota bacterium]
MHFLDESHILIFLFQLFIILILARAAGEICRRIKQPVLTAELLVGILLGPTILGRISPEFFSFLFPDNVVQQTMLEIVSWIGVLFLLLDTGLEIDFSSAWRQKGNALIIAFSDIIVPMAIAFIPSFLLPDTYLADVDRRLFFALFMAVVMTISAMPIASRVMHDLNILKTEIGYLTMSALAVNDIIGWILFTIILGLFAQTAFSYITIFFIFISVIGFSVIALTLGRYFSTFTINYFHKKNMPEPGSSFTFACLLGLLFGGITQTLGIHALFGFFIAGIIVGEAKNLKEETRTVISQMVHSLFVPIFFVNIGLKIDFIANFDIFPVTIVTIIGIAARFTGAWIGTFFSKVPKLNRNLISIAHTPGGMMEIVVAMLAFESGLITSKIFIAIVVSAVVSSITIGPWMRHALNRRKDISILNFLNTDSGIVILHTQECNDAISSVTERVKKTIKNSDPEAIRNEISKRENEFSTAVGHCIAIPHVRMKSIKDPVIIFAFSPQGIDWNAPDGKPVHFLFFLFSPQLSNDLHIEILSKIVKEMKIDSNQKLLLESENKEAVSKALKSIFQK